MHELITNLHMHTRYSDGTGLHADIVKAAIQAGLDVVIVTDHNVLVNGIEGHYKEKGRKLLLLIGEEVHDQDRFPQKSHLLVLGADREVATYAGHPQALINRVAQAGGLSFIAHPRDPELAFFHEDDISWENWEVQGFTGLELWNNLSEFKVRTKSWLQAFFYAFFPQYLAVGPIPEVLERWDGLLASGKRVSAVGGSDAHALVVHAGPFKKVVYPYLMHFRTINTHILAPTALSGDLTSDRKMVYDALRAGHGFIGYDLPAPTLGFRFSAQGENGTAIMGEEMVLRGSVTIQIRLPHSTECNLIKDGKVIKTWTKNDVCTHITNQPGVYRVECYVYFLGQRRGWIFSNPIYLRSPNERKESTENEWSQITLPVY